MAVRINLIGDRAKKKTLSRGKILHRQIVIIAIGVSILVAGIASIEISARDVKREQQVDRTRRQSAMGSSRQFSECRRITPTDPSYTGFRIDQCQFETGSGQYDYISCFIVQPASGNSMMTCSPRGGWQ